MTNEEIENFLEILTEISESSDGNVTQYTDEIGEIAQKLVSQEEKIRKLEKQLEKEKGWNEVLTTKIQRLKSR